MTPPSIGEMNYVRPARGSKFHLLADQSPTALCGFTPKDGLTGWYGETPADRRFKIDDWFRCAACVAKNEKAR